MKTASRNTKTISLEELKDKALGKRGTSDRDEYETNVAAAMIGASIRELRKQRGLTQAQLGELVGVKRSTICIVEKTGTSMTLETAVRLFHALGATLTFNVELLQKR